MSEVLNIEQLKELAKGKIVKLKGFSGEEGDYIQVRMKRPSLLGLVGDKEIPNELLNAVHILFFGQKTQKDVVSMKEANELYRIVAKAALIEPTYQDFENAGVELTDGQLIEIWNYAQLGMQTLSSFREEKRHSENNKPEQIVPQKTE